MADIVSELKIKLDGCVLPQLGPLNFTKTLAKYVATPFVKTVDGPGVFVAVSMGDLATASLLFLSSDKDITVRLNGQADEGHKVLAGDYMFLRGTEITAIEVNNDAGADANIFLLVAGA